MSSTNSLQFHYAQATDVGCVREINEDSIFCGDNLWLVADGMGGHACGEVASQMAVETIVHEFVETGDLSESIQTAHIKIVKSAEQNPTQLGMGTTVVVLNCSDTQYKIAWVGDSRAYLWDANNQRLSQLSEDHSLVVRLVKSGLISVDDAKNHPQRHMITQCLGSKEIDRLSVDIYQNQWKSGQQILLCSDGLTDEVNGENIKQILAQSISNKQKVEQLLAAAKQAGGKDNISIILVDSPIAQSEDSSNRFNWLLNLLKKIFK